MDSHRQDVIQHLRIQWRKWRGELSRKYITNKTKQEAFKEKVSDMEKEDWEWLVEKHFFSPEFQVQKSSARNSKNRSCLKNQMLHRTGSRPFCDVAWEAGGKEGKEPDVETMWRVTRTKDGHWVTQEAAEKHATIVQTIENNPQMPYIEVVDKCFKPQRRDHIIGYGGGVKPKDLRGPISSRAQLMEQLREKDKELASVREELDAHKVETKADKEKMQADLDMLKSIVLTFSKPNEDVPMNDDTENDDMSDNDLVG